MSLPPGVPSARAHIGSEAWDAAWVSSRSVLMIVLQSFDTEIELLEVVHDDINRL
jgi:hypothetical protein